MGQLQGLIMAIALLLFLEYILQHLSGYWFALFNVYTGTAIEHGLFIEQSVFFAYLLRNTHSIAFDHQWGKGGGGMITLLHHILPEFSGLVGGNIVLGFGLFKSKQFCSGFIWIGLDFLSHSVIFCPNLYKV